MSSKKTHRGSSQRHILHVSEMCMLIVWIKSWMAYFKPSAIIPANEKLSAKCVYKNKMNKVPILEPPILRSGWKYSPRFQNWNWNLEISRVALFHTPSCLWKRMLQGVMNFMAHIHECCEFSSLTKQHYLFEPPTTLCPWSWCSTRRPKLSVFVV